jgi:hypothetical protein
MKVNDFTKKHLDFNTSLKNTQIATHLVDHETWVKMSSKNSNEIDTSTKFLNLNLSIFREVFI